jgi:hypothetical protein
MFTQQSYIEGLVEGVYGWEGSSFGGEDSHCVCCHQRDLVLEVSSLQEGEQGSGRQ